MKLSPEESLIAKEALRDVVGRAVKASKASDVDAAITELMSTRDAIISAAITLRAVADKARSRPVKTMDAA